MRANTSSHYGSVTKTFHWITALLILALIPLGIIANDLPYDTSEALTRKAFLFSLHKTLGVTVFFVALARIAWALSQPKPALLNSEKKAESFLAELVHWLLYGSLVIVPLSGWVHHAATEGFAPIWWPLGQNLPFIPKSEGLADLSAGLHIVFERVLAGSIILHFVGAMKHHFIDKDATLKRMLPGKPDLGALAQAHQSTALPIVAALAVWAAALVIGTSLGVFGHGDHDHADAVDHSTAIETLASDWVVQEGTLDITVHQLGSDVSGRFADWSASISFDPDIAEGDAGDVEVQIAIGSLTLGSVTADAMTADFFDAANFPTATITGDVMVQDGAHTLEGDITIKGTTAPLSLPFDLALDGDLATVSGQTTLDRRDFKVGATMTDESTVKFPVIVDLALTAQR